MPRRRRRRRLTDNYELPGFSARRLVRGIFGHPLVRVVALRRRTRRTVCSTCSTVHFGWYDRRRRLARDLASGNTRVYVEIEIRRVRCRRCGAVRKEVLDEVLNSPFVTRRFAYAVGRRCHDATVQAIAKELRLSWQTVKDLDIEYMSAQLDRHPIASTRFDTWATRWTRFGAASTRA